MKIESRIVRHKQLELPFIFMKCDLGNGFSVQCLLYTNGEYAIFEFDKEGITNKYSFPQKGHNENN